MFSPFHRFARKQRSEESIATPKFFSRYGGLWIDREDWQNELTSRRAAGTVNPREAEQVEFFIKNGYLIIPGAVSASECDRFSNDITRAWRDGDPRLLVQRPGERSGQPLTPGSQRIQARVVDSYVYYDSALELLLSDSIGGFLRIIFDENPLLFQSLSFDVGSEQGMHQDTAYVVVSSPLRLAAAWVALEDIQEGSGELMYIPGSHRLPEYHFSGSYKHWSPERDGKEAEEEWARLIHVNAEAMVLKREVFRPRKGDALIWSADLAHGGSPVKNRDLTRKSLVGHYCPNTVDPNYFSFKPDHRIKGRHRNGHYSSAYYAASPDQLAASMAR